jgi:2'-5' RNA ligase
MKDKFLCVMAGYDDNTEKKLSDIQNNLYEKGFVGNHTKNLPQHITLGTFPVNKEEEVVNLLKKVAKETRQFEITFNHIGIFGGSEVLFIAPDTNYSLLKLKENFGESFDWTPHTTMLIDEAENIIRAIPIVAEYFKKFQGRVQTIHLYEFWPARHILTISFEQ